MWSDFKRIRQSRTSLFWKMICAFYSGQLFLLPSRYNTTWNWCCISLCQTCFTVSYQWSHWFLSHMCSSNSIIGRSDGMAQNVQRDITLIHRAKHTICSMYKLWLQEFKTQLKLKPIYCCDIAVWFLTRQEDHTREEDDISYSIKCSRLQNRFKLRL